MTNDSLATATEVRTLLHAIADVAEGIPEDKLDAPTPCTDFTVAKLREHLVQWSTAFGKGFSDKDGQAPDASKVTVEGDGAQQLRDNGDAILEGVRSGGAERDLTLSDGNAMPGDMALAMTLWEYQVHGWDLATALGAPWSPDSTAVESTLPFADQMLTPDYQGEGKSFGPRVEVSDDAPAIDRLVGMSGRDPHWTP